ncbi:hypothetical protein TSUD_408070 [Trifolium subterraneum]|uniref:Reverse transcriptase domain-containing protein n=1 Tax=Trifolium subterraneum TaxID=3900 RepID=A0A2Z6P091_TRISU|nr:hypothetical protein TSUD_408070 [Trifolium subterraneum]
MQEKRIESDCSLLLVCLSKVLKSLARVLEQFVKSLACGEGNDVEEQRHHCIRLKERCPWLYTDAGFNELVLIPMGADKVRWDKNVLPYHRGAWVRFYGIPLHAWNVEFFKLCVLECGRFLRADICSADKEKHDFAQVLIATSDLEIVKRVENVLVDETLVEIKILEEWGYALGEDTCLFEEESGTKEAQSDNEEGPDDPEARRNVDILIENLVDGLAKEESVEIQERKLSYILVIFFARLFVETLCMLTLIVPRNVEERRSLRGGHHPLDHISFNCFIEDYTLIDLPLSGRKITWFKGDEISMSRLYRFLLSKEWCQAWPNCLQVAKMRGLSDHCPLVLSADEEDWGPRPSRMLKCGKDVPDYNLFVKGDANSKYFHSVLASRRRGNAISTIQVGGITLEGVNPIRQAVVSHFKANNMDRPGIDNLVFKRLSPLDSCSLTIPFSTTEVKAAVWDCDNYKSPSPDEINFCFIKDFWGELQGDVMRFITEFHRNDKLTKGLNSTFIALIPKIDSPQRLNDFRTISLVGCLYKVLVKVLVNRLRLFIGCVISESQTAFVKDRQILDGILIVNEVVDEARKSKKELMLFKVDFKKAYDSVDWGYLDDVMGRMTFLNLWRKWIKDAFARLHPEGLHVIMEAMVERNLFTGYSVGEVAPIPISHLQSQYGVERGRLRDGGQRGSSWWREITHIRDGGGGIEGEWFGEHISKMVGDGSDTYFWTDSWVDETHLCEHFGRLFDLAEAKSASVAEMCACGWGAGGEAWVWRQQLRVIPDFDVMGFSYFGCYGRSHLAHSGSPEGFHFRVVTLARQVTHKTKPDRTRHFTLEAHHCVSGCGADESAQHLFLYCSTFGYLWLLVISSWIGSTVVDSQTLSDHFVLFTSSAGGSRARRSFM